MMNFVITQGFKFRFPGFFRLTFIANQTPITRIAPGVYNKPGNELAQGHCS